MNTLNTEWIPYLAVVLIAGFNFSIITAVWFFRHLPLKSTVICSTFIIPLLATAYGFIFRTGLPVAHTTTLGYIAMLMLLIIYSRIGGGFRVKIENALFINVLIGAMLCLALSSLKIFPFLYQDLTSYLIACFILASALVILNRDSKESHTLSGFAILGVSQLAALFQSYSIVSVLALALQTWFYCKIITALFHSVKEEISKELREARLIQKDFDDTLRKEVKKHVFYMEMSQQKLAKISQTDALTEAYNRKGIMNELDRLVSDRNTTQFSMLIFDIDKFKNINDTLGHPVGDRCIRTVAQIARTNLRDIDSLGRYGGDEFIILLPGADAETAFTVAERFRQKVQETSDPHITVSIGIATYPLDGKNSKEILGHADESLYLSKEGGRNRVTRKK